MKRIMALLLLVLIPLTTSAVEGSQVMYVGGTAMNRLQLELTGSVRYYTVYSLTNQQFHAIVPCDTRFSPPPRYNTPATSRFFAPLF